MQCQPQINIKILDDRASVPAKATPGSAGFDLKVMLDSSICVSPGETIPLQTGIAIHIKDSGVAGMIIPRSGLGHKHGIILANGVGLIDSDYTGELIISCWNRSNSNYVINPLDRVAQLVFLNVLTPIFTQVTECEKTFRYGGFGSSGLC